MASNLPSRQEQRVRADEVHARRSELDLSTQDHDCGSPESGSGCGVAATRSWRAASSGKPDDESGCQSSSCLAPNRRQTSLRSLRRSDLPHHSVEMPAVGETLQFRPAVRETARLACAFEPTHDHKKGNPPERVPFRGRSAQSASRSVRMERVTRRSRARLRRRRGYRRGSTSASPCRRGSRLPSSSPRSQRREHPHAWTRC
jgi:hypothetical protein